MFFCNVKAVIELMNIFSLSLVKCLFFFVFIVVEKTPTPARHEVSMPSYFIKIITRIKIKKLDNFGLSNVQYKKNGKK